MANDGTNDCAVGRTMISPTECEEAAKKLGKTYVKDTNVDVPNRPTGCHMWTDDKVYWNHHPTGGPYPSARPVCKRGSYLARLLNEYSRFMIVKPFVIFHQQII